MYKNSQFQAVWKSLSTFCEPSLRCYHFLVTYISTAVIAIALLVATFVFAIVVLRNFGRGLKNTSSCMFHLDCPTAPTDRLSCIVVTKNQKEHTRWGSQHMHHRTMSANPNRMSIDWTVTYSLITPMDLYLSGIHITTDWLHIHPSKPFAWATCALLVRLLRFIYISRLIVVTGSTTYRRTYYIHSFILLVFVSAY